MRKAALALTLVSLFASTTAAADIRPMVLPSGQRYDYRITAPYSGVSLDFAVVKDRRYGAMTPRQLRLVTAIVTACARDSGPSAPVAARVSRAQLLASARIFAVWCASARMNERTQATGTQDFRGVEVYVLG